MKNVPLAEMLQDKPISSSERNCIICGTPIIKRMVIASRTSYCSKCQTKKVIENKAKRDDNIFGGIDSWMGFQCDRSLPQSLRVRKEEVFEIENIAENESND